MVSVPQGIMAASYVPDSACHKSLGTDELADLPKDSVIFPGNVRWRQRHGAFHNRYGTFVRIISGPYNWRLVTVRFPGTPTYELTYPCEPTTKWYVLIDS